MFPPFQSSSNNRMYRTLPSALRRGGKDTADAAHPAANGKRAAAASASSSSSYSQRETGVFSNLHLNLGLSNLISGGMNLWGQLRKKTPTSSGNNSSSSASATPTHGPSAAKARITRTQSSPTDSSGSENYFDFERIELSTFPSLPQADGDDEGGQKGEGHHFVHLGTFNPTWCDLCGDLIWGLYDTGATQCQHCQFTCHFKCQRRVRLNCSRVTAGENSSRDEYKTAREDLADDEASTEVSEANDSTLADVSTLKSEVGEEDESTATDYYGTARESLTLTSTTPGKGLKGQLRIVTPDSDDEFKTLRDVDNIIDFVHDDEEVNAGGDGDDDDPGTPVNDDPSTFHDYDSSLLLEPKLCLTSEDLFGERLNEVIEEYNTQNVGHDTVVEEHEDNEVL